jgi:hypothetical protein
MKAIRFEAKACLLLQNQLQCLILLQVSPINSINIITLVGVCSAGLTTAVQPVAKAGATFQASISIGKFKE